MLKLIANQLVDVYALLWAIGYCYISQPIMHWYRRHRHDADYFTHLGWMVGFLVSIMLFIWGIAQ